MIICVQVIKMEIWKQYRDTNYEVSNLGKVRNKNSKYILKQHFKNNGKVKNDYLRVSLYIDNKNKNISVHRLVAECFLDDFDEKLEVNHKNTKRYDNNFSNLEMTTTEENYQYSLIYGKGSQRKPVYTLDKNGNKIEFVSLWSAGKFIKDTIGIKRDIDHICTNIKQNLKGKCKSAYGYEWFWV